MTEGRRGRPRKVKRWTPDALADQRAIVAFYQNKLIAEAEKLAKMEAENR